VLEEQYVTVAYYYSQLGLVYLNTTAPAMWLLSPTVDRYIQHKYNEYSTTAAVRIYLISRDLVIPTLTDNASRLEALSTKAEARPCRWVIVV